MKKTVAILMAWLVATVVIVSNAQAWCGQGYVLKSELPPQNRITLHDNGVVTTIASVQIPAGTWDVTGGVVVQFNCVGYDFGAYLYSYADVTTDPHHIPNDAIRAIDARPRGTWWFGLHPVKRVFCGPITVYLVVATYAERPADLTEAFGGLIANRFH